jgi:hypothetical protein
MTFWCPCPSAPRRSRRNKTMRHVLSVTNTKRLIALRRCVFSLMLIPHFLADNISFAADADHLLRNACYQSRRFLRRTHLINTAKWSSPKLRASSRRNLRTSTLFQVAPDSPLVLLQDRPQVIATYQSPHLQLSRRRRIIFGNLARCDLKAKLTKIPVCWFRPRAST